MMMTMMVMMITMMVMMMTMIMILKNNFERETGKQVMHNTVTHHPLTNAQPIPEQQLVALNHLPSI